MTKMCVRLERRLAEQEFDSVPSAAAKPKMKAPLATNLKPAKPKSPLTKSPAAAPKPATPKK
jgi:hypothetical protein